MGRVGIEEVEVFTKVCLNLEGGVDIPYVFVFDS